MVDDREIRDIARLHLVVALSRKAREFGPGAIAEGHLYFASIQDVEGKRLTTWPLVVGPKEIKVARLLAEG